MRELAAVVAVTWATTRVGARFRRLPGGRRWLLAEAAGELCRASAELRLWPSHRHAALLGIPVEPPAGADILLTPVADRLATRVGHAVRRSAAALPWRPTCLRQALAARRMLDRRGVPALVHLGVVDARLAEAHAWVTAGDRLVVGAAERARSTTVASFAARRRA